MLCTVPAGEPCLESHAQAAEGRSRTPQHIHGTGQCVRDSCWFPKLHVLAGKSCFIGELWLHLALEF